eukprot:9307617-Pyramimonas_sp.AAC.1
MARCHTAYMAATSSPGQTRYLERRRARDKRHRLTPDVSLFRAFCLHGRGWKCARGKVVMTEEQRKITPRRQCPAKICLRERAALFAQRVRSAFTHVPSCSVAADPMR